MHGLRAIGRQVDDRQATVSQGDTSLRSNVLPSALGIGTTVVQRGMRASDPFDYTLIYRSDGAGDTAHQLRPFPGNV